MRARELEAAGNALFVPAFVPQAHDGPAGLIRLSEIGKGGHGQVQLEWHRIAFEKALDGMVMRFIAKFPCDDPHDFAGVNRGIKLLHIPHILGHSLRIDVAFASGMPGSLIDQAEHALHDEPPGFLPDHRALDSGLPTACSNGFGKEHNGANDFVVVLNGVNALEFILCKVLCRRHTCSPSPGRETLRLLASVSTRPVSDLLPLYKMLCTGRMGVIMGRTIVLSSLSMGWGR